MIQIFGLILLGIVLFLVFLKIAVQGPASSAPDSSAVQAVQQMVSLDRVVLPRRTSVA